MSDVLPDELRGLTDEQLRRLSEFASALDASQLDYLTGLSEEEMKLLLADTYDKLGGFTREQLVWLSTLTREQLDAAAYINQRYGPDYETLPMRLAAEVWGAPVREGDLLKYGDGAAAKVIDLSKKTGLAWFDYATNRGGRDVDLIKALGAERASGAAGATLVIPTSKHGDAPPEPGRQLIRNRLPEVGKGLLSGQWGTLKTFMFLDLAGSIMAGGLWTGEPVYRQGGVLMFAPEGARGIGLRLAAMTEHTWAAKVASARDLTQTLRPKAIDPQRLPFEWTNTCPPLLGGRDPLPAMTATAAAAHERFEREFGLPLVAIGIDTVSAAANFTKEEDNAEAARVMAILERLSVATGTAVIAVDHYGKSLEAGTRGASAKEGNVDFILATLGERTLAGEVRNTRLALRKLKDGPQGAELPFAGKVVDLGLDEHDYPVTSVTIDWNVEPARRRTVAELMLEAALVAALRDHGQTVQANGGGPTRAAPRDRVREAFKQAFLARKPDASPGTIRNTLSKALAETREYAFDNNFVWRRADYSPF